jgi:hypothetical protein
MALIVFMLIDKGTRQWVNGELRKQLMNRNAREIERRLGEAYAQELKSNPNAESLYKDCKETIQSSLGILEHYNKIALTMKGVLGKENQRLAPATVPAN